MEKEHSAPRILLVEDSVLTRRIFRTALQAEGYEVSEATSVTGALDEVARSRPDLVVIDFILDEGDGADLAFALRKMPNLNTVPLISITSIEDKTLREKMMSAPFDSVMSKPVNMVNLVSVIAEMLEKSFSAKV